MEHYGLLGHPLGHSMSPSIHQALFALSGREADYKLLDISPEALERETSRLFALSGFNVTLPHKKRVISLLDSLDDGAARYEAVNVVDCKRRRGYNTDVIGFFKALESGGIFSLKDLSVLILGSGGVSTMFAVESARQGGNITIASRKIENARQAALIAEEKSGGEGKARAISLDGLSALKGSFDLLINGTPVGMYPEVNNCAAPEELIAQCSAVFDCVYNPGETRLMRVATKLGKQVIGGMSMLVWQAAASHTIWYGEEYRGEDMDALTERMRRQVAKDFPPAG